ncbi:glutaminyl-peptide cyclotransferase [Flavobacterium sp. N1719]|uniref:glutaminyl-peptide cyclotransferase n=1 Tax=Flavobacterium sp. N1719 TaxID=2885633 RepID=UPI002222C54A|nr:glutaminyl-peptide cyclotransferase [Flavobacterium sp. N1719]
MKAFKYFTVILLAGITVTSCAPTETGFQIDETKIKATYTQGETVNPAIANPNNLKIDSVAFALNNKRLGSTKGNAAFSFPLNEEKLGYQELIATVYSEGKPTADTTRLELVSKIQPKFLKYTIVNTYPHDITSYTQGLQFYNGVLYEGTGQYGESKLLRTDFKTGKADLNVNLDPKYFGEGITVLNGKVYQLTWQETTGFVYDVTNFKKLKEFQYDKQIEGWGLTNDGTNLYQSDGSEKIYTLDPETLKITGSINVYSLDSKVKELNELEWVDGKIYSNVYQQKAIVVIDPKTGAVEGVLDLSGLEAKITKLPDTDVLNGIAYNPATKTFFVTGKNWDKLFEIKITE